ncbi:MAG: TIGR02281 family clan AA aspartic protease [Paracoccaceae bacterium]
MDEHSFGRLIYLALLGLALGGYFILSGRQHLGQMLRHALLWAMIFVGAVAAFGLWNDMQRAMPRQAVIGMDRIEVPRRMDGHYYLTLQINDMPVEFVVDTGATSVVLSREDAARVGVDLDGLRYGGIANTANGTVRTARIRLDRLELGGVEDRNVAAFITDGDLFASLLGMDYLSRFSRIEIAGDRLILTR